MFTDKFGQQIYSDRDLVEVFLSTPDIKLKNVLMEEPLEFDTGLNLFDVPDIKKYAEPIMSVDQFDTAMQQRWFMPEEYKTFDIAAYVLNNCDSEAELQRAGEELLLYQERDLFMLLRYLKYLVDTMRKNNIVWGVGRGSSVSSFVLYIIGVHKIDSLYYDLPISEFLK